MKLKTVFLLIIAAILIISTLSVAFATQYVFDENGVVIAEPEANASSNYNEDTAIGIIGGADGPTAVVVSGGSSVFLLAALAIAAVSLIIIIVVILKRKIKNK